MEIVREQHAEQSAHAHNDDIESLELMGSQAEYQILDAEDIVREMFPLVEGWTAVRRLAATKLKRWKRTESQCPAGAGSKETENRRSSMPSLCSKGEVMGEHRDQSLGTLSQP